jgi:hypothetical protein
MLATIKTCAANEVKLPNFYNPSLRLSSEAYPKVIQDSILKNQTASLQFNCTYNETTHEVDYSTSYYTLTTKKDSLSSGEEGIIFHTFSDKISPTSARYDVLTFYITFILVIGNFIRGFISGEETKIVLTEMPEPDSLINLCEGIRISRYRFDFEREEYLYYVLIDYMRSPEILKLITKSSIKKLKERKEKELRAERS